MLKTLTNFRDIGGYRTDDHKKVKKGLIYRSGEITDLSKEDHQAFEDTYGIKTIFDFRSESEIEERPNQLFEGVTTIHIDILKGLAGKSTSQEDLMNGKADADEYMTSIYREFIHTPSAREAYKEFLEDVAVLNGPFIFHCFAGKDRTGFGAALILSILGVSKLDIYHDYLLTNDLRKKANDKMMEQLVKQGMDRTQVAEFRKMMEVKAEYLDASFSEMEKEYGTLENYLIKGLGLTQETIKTIREKYTI